MAVSRWRAPNIYVCGGQSPLQTSPFAAPDQKVKWAVNVSHNPPTHSCSLFLCTASLFRFSSHLFLPVYISFSHFQVMRSGQAFDSCYKY